MRGREGEGVRGEEGRKTEWDLGREEGQREKSRRAPDTSQAAAFEGH